MVFKNTNIQKLGKVLWVLIPFVLWLLPADFFDNSNLVLCIHKRLFGVECPGCGMTRAVMHLHHLDFEKATDFNRGVLVVYPILGFLWFKLTYKFFS